MNSIGNRVKCVRAIYEVTQKDFGKKIRVSESTVVAIEKEKKEIDAEYLDRIAKCYRVRKQWLLYGIGPMLVKGREKVFANWARKSFGHRVQWARLTLGLSQKEFGTLINVPTSTASRIEQLDNPIGKHLESISSVCGVNREWLESGDGEVFVDKKSDGEEKDSCYYESVSELACSMISKISDDDLRIVADFVNEELKRRFDSATNDDRRNSDE